MLVGGVPTRCPHQVPPPCAPTRCHDHVRRKLFCTTYFFFENQSMVDFQIKNQSSRGDLDENGRFLARENVSVSLGGKRAVQKID